MAAADHRHARNATADTTAGGRDPLAREVKLLGALLGQVIAEQGGPELHYIDPLSHIQVRFLARLRQLPPDDPDRERFRRLVQLTGNGVAAGLQNTG